MGGVHSGGVEPLFSFVLASETAVCWCPRLTFQILKGCEEAVISVLDRFGTREQTAVDCVDDGCSSNHPSAKVPSVETFDGVLSSLDLIELEVDVAL